MALSFTIKKIRAGNIGIVINAPEMKTSLFVQNMK